MPEEYTPATDKYDTLLEHELDATHTYKNEKIKKHLPSLSFKNSKED